VARASGCVDAVEPELTIRRLLGAHGLRPVGRRQMHALVEGWRPWPRTLAQQPLNVG